MPVDQKTFNMLKGLWNAHGGDPGEADIAAAIAFAESSGCQYALAGPVDIRPVKECTWNRTNGENSCGYWQINLRAHPTYKAPGIFDPDENAKAAVAISGQGHDFGAWSTYTHGTYKQYLRFAGGAPTTPTGAKVGQAGGKTTAPAVLLNSSWNRGWQHFTTVLAHRLPADLQASASYRAAALRTLSRTPNVR